MKGLGVGGGGRLRNRSAVGRCRVWNTRDGKGQLCFDSVLFCGGMHRSESRTVIKSFLIGD